MKKLDDNSTIDDKGNMRKHILYSHEFREWRRDLGLTQRELADMLGSTPEAVCKNEKREVLTGDMVIKILKFFREQEKKGRENGQEKSQKKSKKEVN